MKRKQLAFILGVVFLLGILCACTGPVETPAQTSSTGKDLLAGTHFDPNDPTTWYSDTSAFPTAEDIARVQVGMSLTEVVKILGLPQRDVGSGKVIMEWELKAENNLRIVFGKKLNTEDLPEADSWAVEMISTNGT